MPVTDIVKNANTFTMTVVSEFAADPTRVWQMWEDPRQLERWWGPPEWPATFYDHDFTVGGHSKYYMTGPDGTKMHGWWEFTAISSPQSLSIEDGFADDNGEPTGEHGTTTMTATLEPSLGGTRMTLSSQFESAQHLEEMLAMGMEEGLRGALGQIDGILAG